MITLLSYVQYTAAISHCLSRPPERKGKKSALLLQYRAVWETTRNKTGKEYICMLIWHIYLYTSWCHVKIKEWNLSKCFILQIKCCALEDTLLCIKTDLNTPSMLVQPLVSVLERKRNESLCSRPTCPAKWVSRQPRLPRQTLSEQTD